MVVHTQKGYQETPQRLGDKRGGRGSENTFRGSKFGGTGCGPAGVHERVGGQETGRRGNTAVSPGASGRTYWPCLILPHPGSSLHGTEGLGREQEGEGRLCHGLSRYGPDMVTNCRQEDYREGGRHSTRPPGHQACPQQGCVSDGAWGSSLQT